MLDFGLRKAHGIDGGMSAARAAYLGGVTRTANLLAGKLFNIPVAGTHAHSWVMAFASEAQAFDRYAQAYPTNSVFLVDTYDTSQGIDNAINTGQKLRARGYDLAGIRLDSGNLGPLAKLAREKLDNAGFTSAKIAASSSLDEHAIRQLKHDGAPITLWGVGTRLITGQPDATLDSVYKLSAIQDSSGAWQSRMKLSDSPSKHTTPGIQQLRRYTRSGVPVMDVIYDEGTVGATFAQAQASDAECMQIPEDCETQDLLLPVFRQGKLVHSLPPLEESRAYANQQFRQFAALDDYPVALEAQLATEKQRMRQILSD